jgi:hypothetical protein
MNIQPKKVRGIRQILAADIRSGEPSPINDQIWEFTCGVGEPPAVALQTTYGLRAIGMRIFPRFIQNKIPISDPRAFSTPPMITFFASNFISVQFKPVTSIDVSYKTWVPNSQTLVGQIEFKNLTDEPVKLDMEWIVQLKPILPGSMMTATDFSVNKVLQGQSQKLFPVFFLTGGPSSSFSSYPSLGVQMALSPQSSRQFTWALSTLDSVEMSFYSARKYSAFSLETEQLKIEMRDKQQLVKFDYGSFERDRQILKSQVKTDQLLLPPFKHFSHESFAVNRLPDHGFSPLGDGNDAGAGWGIQSVLDAWLVSHLLLPARPDLLKGIIQNFLDQQTDDGTIEYQASWNGNRTGLLAAPILASIVLDLSLYLPDKEWLGQVYPSLVRYLKMWFKQDGSQNSSSLPTWKHIAQTGFVENSNLIDPLVTLIPAAEFPSLTAMLYHECESLVKLSKVINDDGDLEWLNERMQHLRVNLDSCWNAETGSFQLRDKLTHETTAGKVIHTFRQNGCFTSKKLVKCSRTLFVIINRKNSGSPAIECHINGFRGKEKVEISIASKTIRWNMDRGIAVLEETLDSIVQISITGMKKGETAIIGYPDFTYKDPAFMTPLWAEMLTPERAKLLIQKSGLVISNGEFFQPDPSTDSRTISSELPMFLKIMWVEGLINYGYSELAASFFKNWFFSEESISHTRIGEPAEIYLSKTNDISLASLNDLLPIRVLLRLLGIKKITPCEVILSGFNQNFPPVTVQYNKIKLILDTICTKITTDSGESVEIKEPGPHWIRFSGGRSEDDQETTG